MAKDSQTSNIQETSGLNAYIDDNYSTGDGYLDAEMPDKESEPVDVASNQAKNNVVDSLRAFKSTINKPLKFEMNESTDAYLNNKQKASMKLESLISVHKVTREAKKETLDFFNEYLEENNVGNNCHYGTTIISYIQKFNACFFFVEEL